MVTWRFLYLEGHRPMQEQRALVVDDSKVGRLTMMKKLEAIGMKVELAESGQQALDYLARQQPDMIFMDHMMPELDGFEVTRRIKASPAIRHIPVIIISGNDEASFVEEARAAGAVDAIAKPPANEVLEALLASLPKLRAEAALAAAAKPAMAAVPEPVIEPAAAPSIDMAEVRALVERLTGAVLAPLRDEFRADLQASTDGLLPQMENLRQDVHDARARVDAHTAQIEQRIDGWGGRLDALAETLDRVTRDVQTVHATRSELEQRWDQRITLLGEQFNAARPSAVVAPVDETARREFQAIHADLGELRERFSETRLRQLVAETLDSLQPNREARPVVEPPSQPQANGALHAELAQLKGQLKALSIAVAVGGVLLLAVLGVALFGG
jgi:CheY-like chemotaxis protein